MKKKTELEKRIELLNKIKWFPLEMERDKNAPVTVRMVLRLLTEAVVLMQEEVEKTSRWSLGLYKDKEFYERKN